MDCAFPVSWCEGVASKTLYRSYRSHKSSECRKVRRKGFRRASKVVANGQFLEKAIAVLNKVSVVPVDVFAATM